MLKAVEMEHLIMVNNVMIIIQNQMMDAHSTALKKTVQAQMKKEGEPLMELRYVLFKAVVME